MIKPMAVEITIRIQDGYGSETNVTRKFYPRFIEKHKVGAAIEVEMAALAQEVRALIPVTRTVPEREPS